MMGDADQTPTDGTMAITQVAMMGVLRVLGFFHHKRWERQVLLNQSSSFKVISVRSTV